LPYILFWGAFFLLSTCVRRKQIVWSGGELSVPTGTFFILSFSFQVACKRLCVNATGWKEASFSRLSAKNYGLPGEWAFFQKKVFPMV
jgi:hypothetical protein